MAQESTTAPKRIALIETLVSIVEFEHRVQAQARADIAAAQARLASSIENEDAWLRAIEVPACCSMESAGGYFTPDTWTLRVLAAGEKTPRMVVTLRPVPYERSWRSTTWARDTRPALNLRAATFEALRGRVLLALAQLGLIPWQKESSAP